MREGCTEFWLSLMLKFVSLQNYKKAFSYRGRVNRLFSKIKVFFNIMKFQNLSIIRKLFAREYQHVQTVRNNFALQTHLSLTILSGIFQ